MSTTYVWADQVTLATVTCTCGVVFAMPERLLRQRREDRKSFYCPHGHSLNFQAGEVEQLRRQMELANARARHLEDQRDAADRSNRALRGVITKQRKRAAAGICPCCTRSFADLRRHMASQHPGYADSPITEAPTTK